MITCSLSFTVKETSPFSPSLDFTGSHPGTILKDTMKENKLRKIGETEGVRGRRKGREREGETDLDRPTIPPPVRGPDPSYILSATFSSHPFCVDVPYTSLRRRRRGLSPSFTPVAVQSCFKKICSRNNL